MLRFQYKFWNILMAYQFGLQFLGIMEMVGKRFSLTLIVLIQKRKVIRKYCFQKTFKVSLDIDMRLATIRIHRLN